MIFRLAKMSLKTLRRHRFNHLIWLLGAIFGFFAVFAGDFSMEDQTRLSHDVIAFALNVTACAMALFWGACLLGEARGRGSLEIAWTQPVSRIQWYIGEYLGLAFAWLWMICMVVAIWQCSLLIFFHRSIDSSEILMFTSHLIEGWLYCSLALFLSTFLAQRTCQAVTIALIVIGQSLPEMILHVPGHIKTPSMELILKPISRAWNLSHLNVVGYNLPESPIYSFAFGMSWIFILISLGGLVVRRRSLQA